MKDLKDIFHTRSLLNEKIMEVKRELQNFEMDKRMMEEEVIKDLISDKNYSCLRIDWRALQRYL